ncbi:tRNA preQ1(34) S-adenosylmethionine ribosyltransferase-isomerase QueA [Synechocystis sp. LKSZ1]|uniref:tRNA preQ1(34) S-adenosylmethionine ribosyltransferase-isomerase QueA n=1 Tax=Synechocystis sp. LKSZ1 TaxID=3144951 RepID=UPI00336BCFD6
MTLDQQLASYNYELPPQFIAQAPVTPRDSSRLLVVTSPQEHQHSIFRELPQWLQPGDLLVLNNTQVLPARLYGRKASGAQVEILLLEEQVPDQWLALVKPGKHFQVGTEFYFPPLADCASWPELRARVLDLDLNTGGRVLQFALSPGQRLTDCLTAYGEIPFPPYVTERQANPDQYQTIYAEQPGAVAAPTAGLHFTESLLATLQAKGIQQATVTLHVGVGTFRPVETDNILEHTMHQEWIDVPLETVEAIRATKARGGRVIAVGTTVVRSLEGAAQTNPSAADRYLDPYTGKTELFIYPGYQWRVVDGLITNFHLPKSSLLMLVSALIGRERLLALYQTAIQAHYRFYSLGDAMLILPAARPTGGL